MSIASDLLTWSGHGYSNVTPNSTYVPPSLGSSGAATSYWTQVLQYIGAPVTQSNINFLNGWSQSENTNATFNPLATTQGPSTGNFNSVGVQNFGSANQGAYYTAATITNGHYPSIVNALQGGDASGTGDTSVIAGAGGNGGIGSDSVVGGQFGTNTNTIGPQGSGVQPIDTDGPSDSEPNGDDPLGWSVTDDPNGASEFGGGNNQGTPNLGGGMTGGPLLDTSPAPGVTSGNDQGTPNLGGGATQTATVQGPPGAINITAPQATGTQSSNSGQPIYQTNAPTVASQGLNAVAKAGTQVGSDVQQAETSAAATGTGWLNSIYKEFQIFAISSGLVLLGLVLIIGAFWFFSIENNKGGGAEILPVPE